MIRLSELEAHIRTIKANLKPGEDPEVIVGQRLAPVEEVRLSRDVVGDFGTETCIIIS